MAAAWALCWEMWAPQRWLVRPAVVCFLLMLLAEQLLSRELAANLVGLEMLVLVSGMPFSLANLCRGAAGKVETSTSLLPERFLVLPVSSRALVGWSMLAGAAPMGLLLQLWILSIDLRLRTHTSLLWPGLLMLNVVAWLQALCWMPFGAPYIRMWLAGLGVPGLMVASCVASGFGLPDSVLAIVLAGLAFLAFNVAVVAVERARHGVVSSWAALREERVSEPLEGRYFESPAQALLWREWRVFRSGFWLLYGIALVLILPFLYLLVSWFEHPLAVKELGLVSAVEAVGPGWLALAELWWMPILLGLTGWAGVGQLNPGAERLQESFVLVRPVTNATLVAVKLWLCVRGTWLAGVLLVGIGVGWALPTGHWREMSDRLIALSGSGAAAVLVFLGSLLFLFVIVWSQLAAGLWIGLTGRRSLLWVAVAATLVAIVTLMFFLGHAAKLDDGNGLLVDRIHLVMDLVLICKLFLVIVVFGETVKRGLLSARTLLVALGVWVTVAVGLLVGLAWLVPVEVVGRERLAEGVALALPLARIGLAPLALEWNRHR